jgi:hypothetical protein
MVVKRIMQLVDALWTEKSWAKSSILPSYNVSNKEIAAINIFPDDQKTRKTTQQTGQ